METEILAILEHPGIARIYEAGSLEMGMQKQPFFAMEYVEGTSITEYAYSKNLSIPERLELVAKICESVHYAHQKGVIHRDLKPNNIMVDEIGQPKILDFGIARFISQTSEMTAQTSFGDIVGTIPYMSPI